MTSDAAAAPFQETRGGVLLAVHAQPGARRDEIAGMHGDRLRVRVMAPAQDGRANAALVDLLAASMGLPRSAVALASGKTARAKVFVLSGITIHEARTRLQALRSGPSDVARAPR